MGEGRLIPILGAVAMGALAFAAGAFLLGVSQKVTETSPAAVAEANPPPSSDSPNEEAPKVDAPKAPPRINAQAEQAQPAPPRFDPRLPLPPQAKVRGKWEKMSGYGLPNPRKLTDEEKAALKLLGSAIDIQGYKFSGTTLDDGSTIPGLPSLSGDEVREIVLGKIRSKGLADGFEEAIQSIAVHNPNQLTVITSQQAELAAVEKALGIKAEFKVKPTNVGWWHERKFHSYQIQWINSGWLRFGVDSGAVKMIRAEFDGFMVSYPEYIAAEDVPGGRSDPDPSKALKKAKVRPANAPVPPVEVLTKLGDIKDIIVVPRPGRKDSEATRKLAAELAGKPLYPDMIEAALQCKGPSEVWDFLITSNATMSVDEMTDIMTDTRMRRDDSRTFPGLTVKWYSYFWLEFGIVEGKVQKIRIHCQSMPKNL
jgi:hypothetical protein